MAVGRGALGGRAGIPWAEQPGRMGSAGAEVSALILSSMHSCAGFAVLLYVQQQTCCPEVASLPFI